MNVVHRTGRRGRKVREHMCERKVAYETHWDAFDAILRLPNHGCDDRGQVNVYDCPFCGKYHYGHDPKNGPIASERTSHDERALAY